MNKTLKGLAKLTRFDEYVYFVVIATLLGVAAAKGEFNWRLLIVLLANWLAVGFAFMINDIEDAPDDALSNRKFKRNPVSSGLISPKIARTATFLVGLISAGLFALLGLWPLIIGLTSLILGILYSNKSTQLKTIAFIDIVSHGLMLAGLQFLSGFFTFSPNLNQVWVWPFVFVMSISIYGELNNEIRDLESDRLARLHHTAIALGDRGASVLMIAMLIVGLSTGLVSFLLINIIPGWVLLIMASLAIIFTIPYLHKIRRGNTNISIQGALHKPLERAAALALFLQFILPWLDQILRLGLF